MSPGRKTNANQIAIAKAAGVSVSTVSRALSDARGISDERRAQIRKLAEEAGYLGRKPTPPTQTRNIRAYVTGSLATGGLAPFYEAVIAGLRASAKELGFNLSVRLVDETMLGVERLERDYRTEQSCGAIFVGIDISPELAAYFLGSDDHVVLINGYDPAMRFDCVAPNNFFGGELAARTLLASGHRDLFYVHDHTRWTTMQRRRGFYSALEAYPDATSTAVTVAQGNDAELIAEITRRAAKNTSWTGVFCANDMVAFRLMNALEIAGLSVPGDISVIGFDDLPYAALMHPRLSTMRVDCAEMGRQAISLILRRLTDAAAAPLQIECAVSVQLRETIAQIA